MKEVMMHTSSSLNIFLLRHGKPDFPHNGMVYYGSTDYPLSEEGFAQARRVQGDLKDVVFDKIYVSPMTRAKQTTEIVFPHLYKEAITVDDFREISFGTWEGKTFDEVRSEWDEVYGVPNTTFDRCTPPGGETLFEVQQRVLSKFNEILEENKSGNIVISAHNGVLWSILSHYFALPLKDVFFYNMDYCGIHILSYSDKIMKLLRFNWNSDITNSPIRRMV
ncbi:MAG: histidine phosphatase family protein [Synergistaceae bacterium]